MTPSPGPLRRAPHAERAAIEALGRARVELPLIAEHLGTYEAVTGDPLLQRLVDDALEQALDTLGALAGSTEDTLLLVGAGARADPAGGGRGGLA